jgi:hypothetical protein
MRSVHRTALVLGALLATVGCESPLTVAVENHDPVGYLLRVIDGKHRAWMIPANASGIGPMNDGSDRRFVLVTGLDCTEIGRLGLATGGHTLVVEGGRMADPDMRNAVDPSMLALEQVVDPCP